MERKGLIPFECYVKLDYGSLYAGFRVLWFFRSDGDKAIFYDACNNKIIVPSNKIEIPGLKLNFTRKNDEHPWVKLMDTCKGYNYMVDPNNGHLLVKLKTADPKTVWDDCGAFLKYEEPINLNLNTPAIINKEPKRRKRSTTDEYAF